MTPHRRMALAIGLALAGAAGVAVWSFHGEADPAGHSAGIAAAKPARVHGWQAVRASLAVAPGTDGSTETSLNKSPAAPPPLPKIQRHSVAPAAASLTDAEIWAEYQPTTEELAYRAFKIEQQADKELRNLVQVLDLTEDQQDRVFAALARTSSLYHPSLQAVGSDGVPVQGTSPRPSENGSGGAPTEGGATPVHPATAATTPDPATTTAEPAVVAELTPEQADVYERYTSERDAFWVGVVEDIETELNEAP